MKRSEMIQKISDILETLYGQDRYNYKIAKDILKMQEDERMLPPNLPVEGLDAYAESQGYPDHRAYCEEWGLNPSEHVEFFQWEKEDV